MVSLLDGNGKTTGSDPDCIDLLSRRLVGSWEPEDSGSVRRRSNVGSPLKKTRPQRKLM